MEQTPITDMGSGSVIEVWVVPGASRAAIVGLHAGRVKVRVASPAEGGRANREVTRLLAEHIGAGVTLTKGVTGRRKTFHVSGLNAITVRRKLGIDV